MYDLAIVGGDLYIKGEYFSKNLYIKDGKISIITDQILKSKEYYNAFRKKVFPGFIDPHVHFELSGGKYTSSDNFYFGSISAAFGGITTFIDFLDPISQSIELKQALNDRKELAAKSVIDYAFHATIKNPKGEVQNIVKEMKRLNLLSVKLFTTYSDSDRRTYDKEIKELLRLSKDNQFLVLAHIENDDLIKINDTYNVADLPISRSTEAEIKEALKLASFVKELNSKLYMVHLSSGETLRELKNQYKEILNKDFIVESCPHYFKFSSKYYKSKKGTLYTMAPPLRSDAEVKLLREQFDYVNTIGTDHCPFMKGEKSKNRLIDIPMGIGGVEHSFNIMYGLFKEKAVDKMTVNPAKIFGLYPKKGILQEGSDADIVIYDELNKKIIKDDHSRCDYTVYKGLKVKGVIESTISRGHFVIKKGVFMGGCGRYIR